MNMPLSSPVRTTPRKSMNNIKHGRSSILVQQFLAKHGLSKIELPSTGRFAQDMMLNAAAYEAKLEAMQAAIELFKSHDQRGLTLFEELMDIQMKLARYEHEKTPQQLLKDPHYFRWKQLTFEIIKHYERMQFDLEKIKVEHKLRKQGDDTLFVIEDVHPDNPAGNTGT